MVNSSTTGNQLQPDERFRLAALISSDLIYEWDVQMDTLTWFGDIDTVLGFEQGELPRTIEAWVSRIHPDDIHDLENAVEHHRTSTEQIDYEYRIQHKDGSWRYWRDRAVPVVINGQPVKWVGVCEDITESRETEKKLNDTLIHYQSVFENTGTALIIIEKDTTISLANEECEAITGYSLDQIIGTSWTKYVAPGFLEMMKQYQQLRFEGSEIPPHQYETQMIHANGESIDILVTVSMIPSTNQVIASIQNITERKRAKVELEESEAKYRNLIETSNDMIQSVGKDGRFLFVNQFWKEELKYTDEDISGMTLFDIIHPDSLPHCQELFKKVISGESVKGIETTFIAKDGREILAEGNATPRIWNGEVIGTQGFFRDITQSKKIEDGLRTSEAQLSNAMMIAKLGYWEYDVVNDKFTVNDHFYDIFRTTAEKEGGYTMSSEQYARRFVHPDDAHMVGQEVQNAIEAKDDAYSRQLEHRIIYADGEEGHINVRFFIVKDSKGKTVKTYGANQDITDRKRAEMELVRSEHLLKKIADNYPNSYVSIINEDLTIGFTSGQEFLKMNLDPKSFIDLPLEQVFNEHTPIIKDYYLKTFKGKEQTFEMLINDQYQLYKTVPLRNEQGEINRILAVVENITERKRIELDLLRLKEYNERIIHTMKEGLLLEDQEGIMQFHNVALGKMLGYEKDELVGQSWTQIVPEDQQIIVQEANKRRISGESDHYELELLRKDGDRIPVLVGGAPFLFGETYQGLLAIFTDISDLKIAEERFRIITEHSADAIFITDNQGNYVYTNNAATDLLDYSREEILNMNITDMTNPNEIEEAMLLFKSLHNKGKMFTEIKLRKKDGSYLDTDLNAVLLPNGMVYGSCRDISDRKRLEEERKSMESQIRQSQKLEAIGTLAGGVAHEINNPIQGIMGYVDIIQNRVGDDKELKIFIDGIKKESLRIATIVKNLLYFARKDQQRHSPVRIQDIIGVSLNLLDPVFRKHQITVETNIPEDLPKVKCRSQQIEQVIINLLTNARDALNIKYEGWHENKQILINAQSFQKDGVEWVRTTIEDHGTGIPIEIRDHIFDPFFTTKERGRSSSGMATPPGTGLGLSVSYGIIKDHHGELWVESVEGEYTRFHMDLRVDNGCSLEKPDE